MAAQAPTESAIDSTSQLLRLTLSRCASSTARLWRLRESRSATRAVRGGADFFFFTWLLPEGHRRGVAQTSSLQAALPVQRTR